jgi:uncharacterized membrane protein YdjX (TVP38/TMEM64 family)
VTPGRRLIALVLGVGALALGAAFLPDRAAFLADGAATIRGLGPVAAVTVGAALLVALMPRTPISIACGLLFGAVPGAVCALAATLIAAAVTFAAGRWLGREAVAGWAGPRWTTLERWIDRQGVLGVAAVRCVPLGPYGLMGYAYGTSAVRIRDYALGTIIAGTPSAVTYALLGAAIAGAGQVGPLTLVPLACGLVLVAIVAIRTRGYSWGSRKRQAAPATVPSGSTHGVQPPPS